MRRVVAGFMIISSIACYGGEFDKVKITPEMSYLYVYHKGKAVKIHRIQDTKHKLTGEYAKTYRPGTHIQPISIAKGVETIGEVELLHFLKEKVNKKKGLLLDVRDRKRYTQETIPSAVNVPVEVLEDASARRKLFRVFGLDKSSNNVSGENLLDLAIFCDGLWCKKSTRFIEHLLARGYPPEKIKFYRGGMQMWKILGFTTVKAKKE